MLNEPTFLKLVRAGAWYDIAVAIGFATPFGLVPLVALLNTVHASLGLGGAAVELTPYTTLFANFFGTVVTIWAILRISHASVLLGRYDGAGRLLFAAWQINAILSGASQLIWLFVALELTFGALQLLPVRPGAAA